jgi:hypothetical protein
MIKDRLHVFIAIDPLPENPVILPVKVQIPCMFSRTILKV